MTISLYRITSWVIGCHVAILTCFLLSSLWISSYNPPKTKLVVKTISLKPTAATPAAAPPSKKEVKSAIKTTPKKKIPAKKPLPPQKAKKEEKINAKALAKAKESLSKIKQAPTKELLAMNTLPVDEDDYRSSLASHLQDSLRLPEKGDVRLSLKLDRSGHVLHMDILESKSPRNTAYVEKHLPLVVFPPFGSFFPSMKSHTFTITLASDD